MGILPSPPLAPGGAALEWRALEPGDVSLLADLVARIEEHDDPPYRTSVAEVSQWLDPQGDWRGIVGFHPDGTQAGSALCYSQVTRGGEHETEYLARGGVDVRLRSVGFGTYLLRWQTQVGRELVRRGGRQRSGLLYTDVLPSNEGYQSTLRSLGYYWVSSSQELRFDLTRLDEPAQPPPYCQIKSWQPASDDEARRLYNRLNDSAGAVVATSSKWVDGRPSFRRDWSYVSLDLRGDRPRISGFVGLGQYPQDWDVLGWKEGYIELLGVDDTVPTIDVSRALLLSSMHAQAAAGMDKVAATVTAPSGAAMAKVYEEVGFDPSYETRTYALNL